MICQATECKYNSDCECKEPDKVSIDDYRECMHFEDVDDIEDEE